MIYVCIYIHTYMYVYTYIHTYIHTYMHIHAHTHAVRTMHINVLHGILSVTHLRGHSCASSSYVPLALRHVRVRILKNELNIKVRVCSTRLHVCYRHMDILSVCFVWSVCLSVTADHLSYLSGSPKRRKLDVVAGHGSSYLGYG